MNNPSRANALIFFLILLYPSIVWLQVQNPERLDKRWKTDLTKSTVDLGEFRALLPRDAFSVFTLPTFLNQAQAKGVYYEKEPVIAVERDGQAKAYPLNILTFHELANDVLADHPILVSYCPLCNSAIVFSRQHELNGESYLLEFGVSGMLRKSDMVMWDTQTETWWQQFSGEALVGELSGSSLTILPSSVLSVSQFFDLYPHGQILSKDNPENAENLQKYGNNPYVDYDDPERTSFRLWDEVDSRLPPTERVVYVRNGSETKLFPWHIVQKEHVINDQVNRMPIVVMHRAGVVSVLDQKELTASRDTGTATVFSSQLDGKTLVFKAVNDVITDESGSTWNIIGECIAGPLKGQQLMMVPHGQHFAFASLAFYPDAIIYAE